jgi:luciferase family oxidoreductase group 1
MPGIASAATSVVIGHIAGGTSRIRVGAGGIMLPNHAPLVIAEQFGTLAALYPDRIDLGLGRAPGTDMLTARALRRNLENGVDSFPNDVVELMSYFQPVQEGQRVQAVPGAGLDVPVWILGSSLYGAQLAAMLGLPYAFASHFAPAELDNANAIYRSRFQPAEHPSAHALKEPYLMLGLNVVVADTDDEARFLFSSQQQSFVNLRSGRPGLLPAPVRDYESQIDAGGRMMLDQALSAAVVGSPDTVRRGVEAFLNRTGADELMVTAMIHDHQARKRSFTLLSEALAGFSAAA